MAEGTDKKAPEAVSAPAADTKKQEEEKTEELALVPFQELDLMHKKARKQRAIVQTGVYVSAGAVATLIGVIIQTVAPPFVPIYVGIPMAFVGIPVFQLAVRWAVRKNSWLVNEKTPAIWRTQYDRHNLAYARYMTHRIIKAAKMVGRISMTEHVKMVEPRLKEALSAYRDLFSNHRQAERTVNMYAEGQRPEKAVASEKRLQQRVIKADRRVQRLINTYVVTYLECLERMRDEDKEGIDAIEQAVIDALEEDDKAIKDAEKEAEAAAHEGTGVGLSAKIDAAVAATKDPLVLTDVAEPPKT